MVLDALVGGVIGGILALGGVWLQARLGTKQLEVSKRQDQLAEAAVRWISAVSTASHVNNDKVGEVMAARAALTEAKFRLTVLAAPGVLEALRDLERFPQFSHSEAGRAAFVGAVREIRKALRPEDTEIATAAVEELLLGGPNGGLGQPSSWA